jgi:hypothetical protein
MNALQLEVAAVSALIKKYNLISERSNCSICGLILSNAQQTSCGCYFCKSCIEHLFSETPEEGVIQCPSNLQDCKLLGRKDCRSDIAKQREICKMLINCPFNSATSPCTDRFKIIELTLHRDHCKAFIIQCVYCLTFAPREMMGAHTIACPRKPCICRFCYTTYSREYLDTIHNDVNRFDCAPRKY